MHTRKETPKMKCAQKFSQTLVQMLSCSKLTEHSDTIQFSQLNNKNGYPFPVCCRKWITFYRYSCLSTSCSRETTGIVANCHNSCILAYIHIYIQVIDLHYIANYNLYALKKSDFQVSAPCLPKHA